MAKKYDDIGGVWRTIGGRRVFIKDGQDLASAMKESGKFKKSQIKNAEIDKKENPYATNNKGGIDDNSSEFADRAIKHWEEENNKYKEKYGKDDEMAKSFKERWEKEKENRLYGEKKAQEKNKKENNEVKTEKEKFEVSELKKKAMETLPKEDIDTHDSDLYIKKTKESEALLNNMKDKDSGLLSTFRDQQTGETWYEVPFANMQDDYSEKYGYAKDNYYEGTKRQGFGYANDDNIPVYQNKIDYSGDFTHANLSKVSDEDLIKIANKQSELYNEATNRQVGDRRTYNGKKDEIFKKTDTLRYENGLSKVNEEMQKRDLPRYNIYNKENGMIMVSSPTKEMAERQLKDMYETDKSLQKSYGWKKLPEYEIKEGKVDKYLNERKETLNNDEYLQANRPNEYFQKQLKESGVKTFADEIKEQNKKYTGYQQYLRDRYGTENEDIVSAGNKSKSKLYQEYKDETIRSVNRERMTPGVRNIETAYKRAFEKYKKEHPNTKLTLQKFIDMTEE